MGRPPELLHQSHILVSLLFERGLFLLTLLEAAHAGELLSRRAWECMLCLQMVPLWSTHIVRLQSFKNELPSPRLLLASSPS